MSADPIRLASLSAAMDGGFDVHVGDIVTTEVPGLAIVLQRPSVDVAVELALNDRSTRSAFSP